MFSIAAWLKRKITSRSEAGSFVSKTPLFRALIACKAGIVKVASGFQFTEGPVWSANGKYLLFSDIPANKILKLTPDGRTTVFRQPSGNSNGLTYDEQERLIACEHSNRRVTRTEKDATITVLANKFEGVKLNSPNDVVVKCDGSIYFTDPPYGIQPEQQEQSVRGVYRLSSEERELSLVADDFTRPNGLAFSPDESRLYIDDSKLRHIRIFDVQSDGSLSNGRIFCDMNIERPGSPDGMKIDIQGNVYCTGPGGVWVLDPDGTHLGTIVTPELPSNCAWGDDDRQSLYITARTSIYKIRTNVPGLR